MVRIIEPLNDRIPTSCSACPHMEVNYNSDETYCMRNDGREISLGQGQRKPKWCPLNGIPTLEQIWEKTNE